jgi:iron complex outermembrane recepter protein
VNQSIERKRRARGITLVILGVAYFVNNPSWAEPTSSTISLIERTEVMFEIQQQSLRGALATFVSQSGWRLVYSEHIVEGIESDGVSGEMPPETALAKLLSRSKLGVRMTAPRTGTLVSESLGSAVYTEEGIPASSDTAHEPVKVPEIIVKDVRERGYVTEAQVTATKSDIPLIQAPQSMTVITQDRMVSQEVNSLAQALRYTPGVQSETFGFEPRFTWLRFRGFDATTDGLFRDGLQLRNPGFAVSYSLEPYGAERIEVLRGPASFLYGQGSPGGLLNYISKRPTTAPLHELQFLTGSFNRYEGRMDFGGRLNDSDAVSYRLTGLFRESGTQIDRVPNDRIYIAPAVTWRAAANTQITFFSHFQKDQLGSSQALPAEGTLRANPNGRISPARFTGHPDIEKQNRTEWAAGYELQHQLPPDWNVVQKLRYGSTELDGLTTYSNSLGLDKRTISRFSYGSLGKLEALAVDTQLHGKFFTGPFRHDVSTGVDFQRINVDLRQTFGAASDIDIFNRYDYGAPFAFPTPFLDQHVTQLQTGVYLQDQVKFMDHWFLTVGGRHDWTSHETKNNLTGLTSSQDDRKATGRAALTYLTEFGLAPYVSWSTFFLPSIGVNASDQPFTPETGRQYEFGLKYQPPGTRSLLTVALFDLTRENYVQFDPGTFLPVQRGKARSRGLELEGVASFNSGIDLIASYTFLDNEVLESTNLSEKNRRLTQTPAQFGSVWAKYTAPNGIFKGLGIGGGARYTGSTFADVANTFRVPGFVVGDSMIDYVWNNYRIAVNINNVLNHDQYGCFDRSGTTFCAFGERRTVVGTVAYRW